MAVAVREHDDEKLVEINGEKEPHGTNVATFQCGEGCGSAGYEGGCEINNEEHDCRRQQFAFDSKIRMAQPVLRREMAEEEVLRKRRQLKTEQTEVE